MMQLAHQHLLKVDGQPFYKLMGSGRGIGFNALPDLSTFVLLQVWEDEPKADRYFHAADIHKNYKNRSTEVWTVYLRNISAQGQWDGANPFEKSIHPNTTENLLVLTRATIKWNKLISFWRYVPKSHQPLLHNEGLIYTKGVGEIPLIQMATISIWKNAAALKRFAYESAEHKEAINKTRALNWYKEELFARFEPYRSMGTWQGVNPLPTLN